MFSADTSRQPLDNLTPPREPLTRMDGLLPFLLDAFGGAPAAPDPGP